MGWGDADKKAQAAAKAEREQKRKNLDKATGATGGPAGYREVGCGTVSLFDAEAAAILAMRCDLARGSGESEVLQQGPVGSVCVAIAFHSSGGYANLSPTMPLYEFQCLPCNLVFEELVRSSTEPVSCPKCAGDVKRLLSACVSHVGGDACSATHSSGGSGGCGGCHGGSCSSCH